MKETIVFDFDGVIHSYISGWLGEDVIPDKPVEGIKEAIRASNYEVVVVSTRCASEKGLNAVIKWLEKYNITVDRVLKEKPPATVYIDDRAICFDGQADKLLSQIKTFKTWSEKEKQREKLLRRRA